MSRLGSWAIQLALLILATFFFIVVYAHGFSDFPRHAAEEFRDLVGWMKGGANFPPPK